MGKAGWRKYHVGDMVHIFPGPHPLAYFDKVGEVIDYESKGSGHAWYLVLPEGVELEDSRWIKGKYLGPTDWAEIPSMVKRHEELSNQLTRRQVETFVKSSQEYEDLLKYLKYLEEAIEKARLKVRRRSLETLGVDAEDLDALELTNLSYLIYNLGEPVQYKFKGDLEYDALFKAADEVEEQMDGMIEAEVNRRLGERDG